MGDAKWVKFEVNMFDDTKLKIIDNMDERDSIHYFWTRLLVLAGKINCGGYLYITDNIAYTIKTFAIEFNRSIDEVKTAFKVLKKLEMIEFTEDKAFKIKNWEKHQNVEGLERLRTQNNQRVAKHRAKKKETKGKNEEEANNYVPEIDEDNKQIKNNNEETKDKGNLVEEDKGYTSDFNEEVVNAKDIVIDDINKNEEIETKECTNSNNESSNILEQNNDKDNVNNSNATENVDDNVDINTNENCNVTSNDNNSSGNITVMEQKKKENKKKREKKRESKSDIEINEEDDNSLIKFSDPSDLQEINENEVVVFSTNFANDASKEDFNNIAEKDSKDDFKQSSNTENETLNNQAAAKLLKHHQSMTGVIGGLNLGALKLAISMHGYENVKMAINKALEVNKSNMTYINGILKNWRREGYPKEKEAINNGVRSIGKNSSADKNKFT